MAGLGCQLGRLGQLGQLGQGFCRDEARLNFEVGDG
jgi:hypothetical protein